ncbi:hypothetical protein HPCPY6261_0333 [Helicobacter pylori CPY6261]|nr:hypothetical protein HPCPY6261_0333 [Helicobacter pylori CPY6261]
MKTWNEMDIKEQKELFVKFLASEIAQSLDAGLEFKANNRAYNGNAGNAYNGLNSLILDAKQHENGYESNVWVGLDDALKLGANPKEVEHIKNNTKSKIILMAFMIRQVLLILEIMKCAMLKQEMNRVI